MHEISLIRSIFNTLESEFSTTDLQDMTAINLKVGKLSNVEPILLQNAFDAVTTAEEKYQSVQLNVELVPIEIYCKNCDTHSEIKAYKFVCASCQQPNNNVVKGTELLIHQIQFSDEKSLPTQ